MFFFLFCDCFIVFFTGVSYCSLVFVLYVQFIEGGGLESTAASMYVMMSNYNQGINQYFSFISNELNDFSRLVRFYFFIEVTSVMFFSCIF